MPRGPYGVTGAPPPRRPVRRLQGTDVNGRTIEFSEEIAPLARTMYTDIVPVGRGPLPGAASRECPRCGHDSVLTKPGGQGWSCPNCAAEST